MNKRPSTRSSGLRHLLTFERQSGARDPSTGGYLDEWVTAFQAWGSKFEHIRTFTADEVQRDSVHAGYSTIQFRIRYRTGVDLALRVRHRGKIYRVVAVAEVGNREWVDLMSMEWSHEQGL